MHFSIVFSTLITIASLGAAAPPRSGALRDIQRRSHQPHARGDGGEPAAVARRRANAVKKAFQTAWDGYYQYAFPNDELLPVSNDFSNSRNGWGASAADALSTALVMGKSEVVNQILDHIPTIDWSVSADNEVVSVFETTIRYLGGMLAGYDLLSGPLASLADNKDNVEALLVQSQNLANNLSFAFETPTGIPNNYIYVNNRTTDGDDTNGLAQIGTLVLEWQHLSDLTGNKTYGELAQKAESYLLDPQPTWNEPWPGLLGYTVNLTTGLFEDAFGAWTGGTDSFYEYLIKMYVYDPERYASYKDRWVLAADSSIEHLASHPETRPDLTFLADYDNKTLSLNSQHLACFDGGNFILGGLVLNEQKYVDFGLDLVEGCHETYVQTLSGIGPEQFSWDASSVPKRKQAFFERAGFYITNGFYDLRPEVIESFYYAYRATGNRLYQDWAWNAFKAITAKTRVGSGYAGIFAVNRRDTVYYDFQESFFFAETLKYCYLIHAPDAPYQVNSGGVNEYVYNTEAHPLKVAGKPI